MLHTGIVYHAAGVEAIGNRVLALGTLALMDMASRVRALREAAGVSQEDLARRLDVSQRWVSGRETGSTKVKTEDLERIATALGFDTEFVIVPRGRADLARAAADASPEAVAMAIELLQAVDSLPPAVRGMIEAMLRQALAPPLASDVRR